MSYTTKGLSFLFILALPIFLITTCVAWAVNDLRVYNHGFDKYDVSGRVDVVGNPPRPGIFDRTSTPEKNLYRYEPKSSDKNVKFSMTAR